MAAVVRAWLGFFALGAGLIHLALVIGAPLGVGVPLLLVGVAEFAWGVFAFTSSAVPLARAARIGSVVPILGWVVLLVLDGADALPGIRVLPMLIASLFDVAIAVTITLLLRNAGREPRPMRSGAYLLWLAAGALVVAALTTPALAATEAGDVAPSHGTLPGEHPGH